jgi:N-acetylglucosamine-6-sulfatase
VSRKIAILVVLLLASGCSSGIAQMSSPETTASPESPNILFVLTDDQDPATLAHMPNVKALLRDNGRTFTNTVNTNPLCCPSRATMQRGQYSHNTGVLTNGEGYAGFERMGLHNSTMATWVDSAGYRTGAFGRFMNGYAGQQIPGWDELDLLRTAPVSESARQDLASAEKGLTFLEEATASEEPFMAFVGFWAPHAPYVHPKGLDDEFTGVKAPRMGGALNEEDVSDKPAYVRRQPRMTANQLHANDEHYRDALRSLQPVDDFVGEAVETLRRTGELDNTYVFFYTDNGIHTGYHRLPLGKRSPYDPDVGFPLMVRGPGVPAGSQTQRLVGNHDLAPTMAELAGAQVPDFVDGRSLLPLLSEQSEAWRSAILSENYPDPGETWKEDRRIIPRWRAVRTERYAYIEYATGERELYNLKRDPNQLNNLMRAGNPKPALMARLSGLLDRLKRCSGDSCRSAENS